MQRGLESGRFVRCSEHIFLGCECGETLVLLGGEEDWQLEGRTVFECGCGRMLTLADRFDDEESSTDEGLDEEARRSVRGLLRSLRRPET